MTSINAGISPLDQAYGFRSDSKPEDAARIAIALLDDDPHQLDAAMLLAQLLVESGREFVAGEVLVRVVDGFIRRGDLPQATVAASLADDAKEDGAALRATIAEAFCKDSKRISDVPQAPPPLPKEANLEGPLKTLTGDVLWGRAENALEQFLSSDDPHEDNAKLPELPLFSSLKKDDLAVLLGAMKVVDLAKDRSIINQGELGHEAYVVVRGMVKAVRDLGAANETILAALGPGSLFGEMALVSETPRGASVVALEATRMLMVDIDDLEAIHAKAPAVGDELGNFCHHRMIANLMRSSAIFSSVDPAYRDDLIGRFQTRQFEPGETLIERDQEGTSLFLIASGTVRVSAKDEDGDDVQIATLGAGDVVGEISLVLRKPANATVVASHATVALELSHGSFQEAISAHPTVLNDLYQIALQRDEVTRSVVAQEAMEAEDFEDLILL